MQLTANYIERAWSSLRSGGLTATLSKARTYLKQEREYDHQVRIDARRIVAKVVASGRKGLFVDCGSNIGQGFTYFERRYSLKRFDYILVEPNPNCRDALRALIASRRGNIKLIDAAASTQGGTALFYGLTQSYRGMCSDAGSILKDHNSVNRQSSFGGEISVPTFSLAERIEDWARQYACVVLKLDIEGAEYDVLEDVLAKGAASKLEMAYVEFHSEYMVEPERSRYQERERLILAECDLRRVPIRLWH